MSNNIDSTAAATTTTYKRSSSQAKLVNSNQIGNGVKGLRFSVANNMCFIKDNAMEEHLIDPDTWPLLFSLSALEVGYVVSIGVFLGLFRGWFASLVLFFFHFRLVFVVLSKVGNQSLLRE
jgi:hypothetical protein